MPGNETGSTAVFCPSSPMPAPDTATKQTSDANRSSLCLAMSLLQVRLLVVGHFTGSVRQPLPQISTCPSPVKRGQRTIYAAHRRERKPFGVRWPSVATTRRYSLLCSGSMGSLRKIGTPLSCSRSPSELCHGASTPAPKQQRRRLQPSFLPSPTQARSNGQRHTPVTTSSGSRRTSTDNSTPPAAISPTDRLISPRCGMISGAPA
jgi:hypothetical protein